MICNRQALQLSDHRAFKPRAGATQSLADDLPAPDRSGDIHHYYEQHYRRIYAYRPPCRVSRLAVRYRRRYRVDYIRRSQRNDVKRRGLQNVYERTQDDSPEVYLHYIA